MMKQKCKVILSIFLGVFVSLLSSAYAFASDGVSLLYDQAKGRFSIIKDKAVVIKDASSYAVLSNNVVVKSDDAQMKRQVQKRSFKDAVGQGTQFTYTNTNRDGVQLKQHFYVYNNKPYILLQVELVGNKLSSNEIVAIHSDSQITKEGKAWHQVIVPFDNDEFIAYNNKVLTEAGEASSEVGLLLDKNSQQGLIIAALDQSVWKSGISFAGSGNSYKGIKVLAGFTNKVLTHDDMPHGSLHGNTISTPKYMIRFDNDWRQGMEEYAKVHRALATPYVKTWDSATPVGWNSWGVIQEKIDFQNAVGNAKYFKDEIPYFRNADGEAFIDLDSFWDNMTPGGMSGDYTQLKAFVDYCEANGLKAGAYWAPFTDWGFRDGPNRKMEGSDYTFGDVWTKTKNGYHDLDGGRSIDPTHPGTQKRMNFILERLVNCGFKMIKIDFLSHAAIEAIRFHDPKVTTGMQSYAVGMKHLVDVLDNNMLIYAAISPSLATAQFAHMRRIACDAWNTIDQTEYTLNSVSYGWWQTYMYDFVDADHLVFHDQPLGVNKARLLSGVVAGPIILGDDFSKKQSWQSAINPYLQDAEILAVIKDGKSFRPLGFVDGKAANNTYVKHTKDYVYIAFFNFKQEKGAVVFDFNQLGLQGKTAYDAVELFDKTKTTLKQGEAINFAEAGAKLFRIKL